MNASFSRAWLGVLVGLSLGLAACASDPDPDGDGVDNPYDLCPDSPSHLQADEDGCTAADDRDGDGVQNDRDLCPDTPEGAVLVVDGCASEELDEAGNPLVSNPAFDTFTYGSESLEPIVFRSWHGNHQRTAQGFELSGTLLVQTPMGHMALVGAEMLLETVPSDPTELAAITGSAAVPFPSFGALSFCAVDDLVNAEIGIGTGETLSELGAPLAADRSYVFFRLQAGLSATCGGLELAAPGGQEALVVFDTSDPMMYLRGSLLGLDSIGPFRDVGIGVSAQGLIPFEPDYLLTQIADGDSYGNFDGHLFLEGSTVINGVLGVDGEVNVDFDPDGDNFTFTDLVPDFGLGINGALDLIVSFAGLPSFTIDLGEGTVVASVKATESSAYFSGVLAPSVSWIPAAIKPTAETRLEGLITSDVSKSYLFSETEFSMDLGTLANTLGGALNAKHTITGRLDVNETVGIQLSGTTVKSFSPLVALDGVGTVTARFKGENDWSVELVGDLSVGGVGLSSSASMLLTPQGLSVAGSVDLGYNSLLVTGSVSATGVSLSGTQVLTYDLVSGLEVVETVVDGALCGYALVQNGAVCGFKTVTNAAVCGSQTVTSALLCGTETITDGAICGFETVGCWINPFNWGNCTKPASCSQAATCEVANTCEDLNAPKACEDLSQPLSCDKHSIVPDHLFGQFVGTVNVTIDQSGLSGSVAGDYCLDGACDTLANGYLEIGSSVQACIDVSVGSFCTHL